MPPFSRRPRSNAHKPRRKQHPGKPSKQEPISRNGFNTSRTQDIEEGDDVDNYEGDLEEDASNASTNEASGEEDGADTVLSYAGLLQSLNATKRTDARPSKRRKLEKIPEETRDDDTRSKKLDQADEAPDVALAEEAEEGEEDAADDDHDSDDEETLLQDPFELHYGITEEKDLKTALDAQNEKPSTQNAVVGKSLRKTTIRFGSAKSPTPALRSAADLKLKHRLKEAGLDVFASTTPEDRDVLGEMFNYKDILFGARNPRLSSRLRDMSCLHALNHMFKTRDRVLKNNAKLAQEKDIDAEFRDQGFTRPKVLVIVPTKQACVRFVDSIVRLSEPDQQENRSRFLDTFSQSDPDSFDGKPEDFCELFGGNHDEDFRVGLKFTRKTIKFFSGFYNSDIIFASALGLMRTITTGGGGKDKKKGHDADFLSSIEIAIVDHANAIEMQNWQHIDYLFSQLNQLPKESHGCDFARARSWYLDGKAQFLRQTIIFSDYLTPSINALCSTHLHNIAGRVKYVLKYEGAMLSIPPSIPMTVTQTFLRFDSPSPQSDSDMRFKFFTSTILPTILRGGKQNTRGTLIFVPTYLDFVRLRNHFSTAAETTSLSFGTLSEYSSVKEGTRARSHFMSGRHSVLLYSERAHHYFRYHIKGVRRLLFYSVPENPLFWNEMLYLLGLNGTFDVDWVQAQKASKHGKGLCRAIYSKWDILKVERIVGSERVGRLVSDNEGDVFDFV